MAYRLTMSGTAGEELRACAAEELQRARDGLAAAGPRDRAAAVHAARKNIKKTRSLLRLARPALGERRYREVNAALRDAGATLSAARDADVLVVVIDGLQERAVGRVPAAGFARLQEAARQAVPSAAPDAETGGPVADAIARLDAVLEDVDHWPLRDAEWATVLAGLRRAYARGHAECRAVRKAPTTEARHDWRKRVKDLWYHQRLLAGAWEPVLRAQGEEAHRLSELLGDDHDLAVLHEAVASGRLDAGPDADAVLALVDGVREELLDDAVELGRRLYAETPKAFIRRTRRYMRVWEAAAAAAPFEV